VRNRSFAGPIVLIGLGVLFLISNVMPEITLWRILADWWPVLLIAFGVIRLIEVLAQVNRGPLPPQTSRGMGFGWVIVLVIFGLLLSIPHHVRRGNWHWGPIRAGGVELLGQDFDYPVSITTEAGPARKFVLDDVKGTVSVKGTDDSTIRVEGTKIVRAYDRGTADKANDSSQVRVTTDGDTIYLRMAEPPSTNQSQLSVSLDISIPKAMAVETRARSGDLNIESLNAPVTISSQRGEVRVNDITGNVKLDVSRSDLIRANNVKGTIDLQGDGRDIQLEDVSDQVTINGRFSGTLDFRNLAKPLHFESEQTDFRVEKLPGTINMDLRDLRASDVTGPLRFVTRSRDVHLDGFSGPIEIDLSRGDLDLKPSRNQLARVDVRTQHGNIDVALPSGTKFDLRGQTKQGEVTNDYGEGVVADTQGRAASVRSAQPNGPQISLTTDRGGITVRKLE
jgi:DUF4097 and DUF4098 domain-containing protein YvlB